MITATGTTRIENRPRKRDSSNDRRDGVTRSARTIIDEQARWRREKAEEYPDDGRNERAANGLVELAEYVRSLPENDERLRELMSLSVVLPVWLGAVLMSASTIIVAINAQTLRRLRLRGSDGDRPALQAAPA